MKRSSTHIIHLDNKTFTYTLHRKKGQKHKYIRIKGSDLIVSAPYLTPINSINAFVYQKSDWILKHTDKKNEKFDLTSDGAFIYFLGDKYPIELSTGTKDHLQIKDNKATFVLQGDPSHEEMLLILQKFYKSEALKYILPRVEYWSKITGLEPVKISFRKAKTRWGSCSSRDSISLNTALMMLPDGLLDYIIVHELSHIRHKNHSQAFWEFVADYIPEYRSLRKDLRHYERFLHQ